MLFRTELLDSQDDYSSIPSTLNKQIMLMEALVSISDLGKLWSEDCLLWVYFIFLLLRISYVPINWLNYTICHN